MIEAAAVADDGIGIVLGPQLRMQHGAVVIGPLACSAHALAPFRIWAMWINFIGTPMRSAQPMHQARAVGRYNVLGAGLRVVADLVVTHLGGNDLLEHREGAAETAAFVGPGRINELHPLDLGEQVHGLGEERLVQLGRPRVVEPAQSAAAVVQTDPMREFGPGECIDLQNVVKELDQLVGSRADFLDRVGARCRRNSPAHGARSCRKSPLRRRSRRLCAQTARRCRPLPW